MGVGSQEIAHIRNAEGSAQIRSTINDSKDLVKQGNLYSTPPSSSSPPPAHITPQALGKTILMSSVQAIQPIRNGLDRKDRIPSPSSSHGNVVDHDAAGGE